VGGGGGKVVLTSERDGFMGLISGIVKLSLLKRLFEAVKGRRRSSGGSSRRV